MNRKSPKPVHVWLVMLKAGQAVAKYAASQIQETGLGDSDFRVLEALLHKGPLPVNTIGPKVNLTPGSISVAVDRLHGRGLVTRTESAEDRRVRIVALTPCGRNLIEPVFQQHAALLGEVCSDLTTDELMTLQTLLKKVGRRAEALSSQSAQIPCAETDSGGGVD